jgi:hypothetical protein
LGAPRKYCSRFNIKTISSLQQVLFFLNGSLEMALPVIIRSKSERMTGIMRYDHMAQQLKVVLPVVKLCIPQA